MTGDVTVDRPTIAKMVFLNVREDRLDEVRALLEATRAASADEPGTIAWELHDGIDGHASFVLYESFLDEAAVAHHDSSPAVAALIASFDISLAAPPVAHALRVR